MRILNGFYFSFFYDVLGIVNNKLVDVLHFGWTFEDVLKIQVCFIFYCKIKIKNQVENQSR